jgi:hypothetical protein
MCVFLTINVLQGCKTVAPIEPSYGTSSVELTSVIEHATDSLADIKRDATAVIDESNVVRKDVVMNPEKTTKGDITRSLDKINSKAVNIVESADSIVKEIEKLKDVTTDIARLEKSLSRLQITLEETKAKALDRLYAYISIFWVIGFLLIAGGAAVAFFLNKGYGASLALIGLLMLGFASASQYYMQQIAFVGAILLVLGFLTAIGMVVWSTINSKRHATAIREVVEMIQILKETMTDDEQNRIFGVNGIANNVQSDLTKEIIAKIKEQNGFKKLEEARKAAVTPPSS